MLVPLAISARGQDRCSFCPQHPRVCAMPPTPRAGFLLHSGAVLPVVMAPSQTLLCTLMAKRESPQNPLTNPKCAV